MVGVGGKNMKGYGYVAYLAKPQDHRQGKLTRDLGIEFAMSPERELSVSIKYISIRGLERRQVLGARETLAGWRYACLSNLRMS